MRTQRLPWLLGGLVVLGAVAGCRACGRRRGAVARVPVERLLSPNSDWVLLAPVLGRLGADAASLAATLVRLPEGELVGEGLRQLTAGLGFDPFTPGGLAAVGLDPLRSAALAEEGGLAWVALPVSDPKLLSARVARLAAERLGATVRARTPAGVETFALPSGAPAAALAFREGYALLAQGPSGGALLARILSRGAAAGLDGEDLYRATARRLGGAFDLSLYLPAASRLLPQPPRALPGRAFALGVGLSGARISVRGLALLSVAEGAALAGFALPAGQGLVPLLAPGSPLVVRIGGEPGALGPVWRGLAPRELQLQFAKSGLNPEKDLLRNLGPGLVFSVGLSPELDLSSPPTLDPRRGNPFRYVTFEGVAKVRDAASAAATLPKLFSLAPSFGASVVRRLIGSQPVDTFHYAVGEGGGTKHLEEGVSVALAGDTLLVTGGGGAMEAALLRLAGGGPRFAVAAPFARALTGHVSDGLVFDTGALLAAVGRVPPSAYDGLTGLTIRSLVERLSAPLEHLGPLTGTVEFQADAAIADATLPIR